MEEFQPQHLYRWYDSEGQLLYVGISVNAYHRASQHKRNSRWFYEASNMTIETFPNREAVALAEIRAIRSEKPKYNILQSNSPIEQVIGEDSPVKRSGIGVSFRRTSSGRIQARVWNPDEHKYFSLGTFPSEEAAWVAIRSQNAKEIAEALKCLQIYAPELLA